MLSPNHYESDAEIILRCYQRFGICFVQRLRGSFALVLEDRECDLQLAARDPLGTHPLFYAETPRQIIFSTAVRDLLPCSDVSGEINRAAIADHLCHRWPCAEETFFEDVKRLPPGHVLLQQRGRRALYRYWDPSPIGSAVEWLGESHLGQFDELFEQAIERCLQFGPAGIYLSGGLDSVSIAALAAEKSRQTRTAAPRALSVSFPHPDCNEAQIQTAVAAQLGLPIHLTPFETAVGDGGLLTAALSLSASLATPLQNVWLPAYVHLATHAADAGCRVILTGSGGDEWLAVTPRYAADLIRRGDLPGLYSLYRSIRRSYSLPAILTLRNLMWTNGARPLLGSVAAGGLRRASPQLLQQRRLRGLNRHNPGWIAPDPVLRRELLDRATRQVDEELAAPRTDWYWRDVRTALDHPLMLMEQEEGFEYGRKVGVRILHPYWDRDLVSFLYRVPPDLLNRGGRSKSLVRETLARRFPQLGFERQRKVSAEAFFQSIVMTTGAQAWRTLGGARALAQIGVVDGRRLAADMDAMLRNGNPRFAERIWDVLNLESWTRSNLKWRGI
jgi:asparagine synthase (glutamine-hydrolysing)